MHILLRKFSEESLNGTIRDGEPIPNNLFTYEELEYLYNEGYLMESKNEFIAVVPESFD